MLDLLSKTELALKKVIESQNFKYPSATGLDESVVVPPLIVINANTAATEIVYSLANYSINAIVSVYTSADDDNALAIHRGICAQVYDLLQRKDLPNLLTSAINDYYVYFSVVTSISQSVRDRRYITQFNVELICINKNIS